MTLAGTMPGGPAEAAGLIKNDVITAINDFGIVDIYDFMDALGVFKDGQTVIVHFIRAEQEMTMELTFFPRPVEISTLPASPGCRLILASEI